jgi:hypothetical protein
VAINILLPLYFLVFSVRYGHIHISQSTAQVINRSLHNSFKKFILLHYTRIVSAGHGGRAV